MIYIRGKNLILNREKILNFYILNDIFDKYNKNFSINMQSKHVIAALLGAVSANKLMSLRQPISYQNIEDFKSYEIVE